MKFTTILALLPLALAAPPAEARDLSARATPGNVWVCAGAGWAEPCQLLTVGLNNCMEIPEPQFSSIGSIGPDPGALCRLFDGSATGTNKCTGSGLAIESAPGNNHLYDAPSYAGYKAKYISCISCEDC
ncbi:hypothetical protein OQA88_5335 [Cercophora sp. LCS_1]